MAGIIEARFRESKSFCEQIGHRSFVIIPHEICVKKATATMMITYYEFHYYNELVKLQFVHKMQRELRTKKHQNMI